METSHSMFSKQFKMSIYVHRLKKIYNEMQVLAVNLTKSKLQPIENNEKQGQ